MEIEEELRHQAKRLESLENHVKFFKESTYRIEATTNKISDALLGTEFGNDGLINNFKKNAEKTSEIEKELEKLKIYFKQVSWLFGIVASAIIVILIKYIFKGI